MIDNYRYSKNQKPFDLIVLIIHFLSCSNYFHRLWCWFSLIAVLHCPHYSFSKLFKPFYSIFLIAVLIMQSVDSVTATRFDYYRLSETWLVTYCRSNPCHKHVKHDRFHIHGLWFDNYNTPHLREKSHLKKKKPNKPYDEVNFKICDFEIQFQIF